MRTEESSTFRYLHLLTMMNSYKLRINKSQDMNASRNIVSGTQQPQRATLRPIAEPSENMAAVAEVAVGCFLAEAGLTTLSYSLAPGTN